MLVMLFTLVFKIIELNSWSRQQLLLLLKTIKGHQQWRDMSEQIRLFYLAFYELLPRVSEKNWRVCDDESS